MVVEVILVWDGRIKEFWRRVEIGMVEDKGGFERSVVVELIVEGGGRVVVIVVE